MLRWPRLRMMMALGAGGALAALGLPQYARSSGVLPPLATSTALGLLWLGQLITLTFVTPLMDGSTAFAVFCKDSTAASSITEVAIAIGILQLHAPTTGLKWLVGLSCVQAFIYHTVNPVIKNGLSESKRAVAKTAPSIHSRWHAEHENWWYMQLFKLQSANFLVDMIKLPLLAGYLWGLRE